MGRAHPQKQPELGGGAVLRGRPPGKSQKLLPSMASIAIVKLVVGVFAKRYSLAGVRTGGQRLRRPFVAYSPVEALVGDRGQWLVDR